MFKMYSFVKCYVLHLILFWGTVSGIHKPAIKHKVVLVKDNSLYDTLGLSGLGLSMEIFDKAIAGRNMMSLNQQIGNPDILSIVDLSQSCNAKRLYIIDLVQRKVLFNTYVAHGRNSGEEYAKSFSNKLNSYKSSLGFYLTKDTYKGAHGLSMRLKGVEKGINDIAEDRGIVIHGAHYVSESFINQNERLGRSQGCPAIPQELCVPIINAIKGGTCFFMYSPDTYYLNKTSLCKL